MSPPPPLRDPRVEALVAWAQSGDQPLDDRGSAALAALQDSPPDERTAAALAVAAAAAYARVALRGPRDLHAGHALVRLLGALGEAGPIELVRLLERIHYHHARRRITRELTAAGQRLGVTHAELEDRFGGPVLAADLTMSVPVGSFEALVSISDDVRRVRTSWRGLDGAPVQRRPARAVDDPDALALLRAERRRLQTHLSDLRRRLEDAMMTGRSWSADEWARRMLGDPLRSALTHRMIWRVERDDLSIPALLETDGLRDVHGDRVDIDAGAYVALWHPAQDPTLQPAWADRLAVLGIKQPIDQADREITLAQAPTISFGSRPPVAQMPMRGFLRQRGWEMPHLGRFHAVPEATRQVTSGGPVAVLLLEQQDDNEETVQVKALKFDSADGRQLDATQLPPALVSETARDVLGALHAAGLTHTRASPQSPAKHMT